MARLAGLTHMQVFQQVDFGLVLKALAIDVPKKDAAKC